MTRSRLLPPAVFLLLAGYLVGCGSNNPLPARISGSLSYKGQPIKGGTIRFFTPEGTGYDGQLSEDGTYTATDLPTGELVVAVETETINPAKKGDTKSPDYEKRMKYSGTGGRPAPDGVATATTKQNYVKIPEKYGNPKTSPLTVSVKNGRQVHNIDLTD